MSLLSTIPLIEGFNPPKGYSLDSLVATTYSVSPLVMAAFMASSSFSRESVEIEGDQFSALLTKEQLRHLILENQGKCVFLCDHHGPIETQKEEPSDFELVLAERLVKYKGRNSHGVGSLHSKFVLALYKNGSGEAIGRLYLGSKNLTMANYAEFGGIYELRPSSKRTSEPSEQLVKILKYLIASETEGKSAGLRAPIERAVDLIKNFKLSLSAEVLGLLWQNRCDDSPNLFRQLKRYIGNGDCRQIRIFSPWARAKAAIEMSQLLGQRGKMYVRCLDEAGLSTLESSQVEYQLDRATEDGMVQPRQSHEKIYLFRSKKRDLLAFGSANFSGGAWGLGEGGTRNTESLVLTAPSTNHIKYLERIHGQENVVRVGTAKESEQEKAAASLESLTADVEYIDGKINYTFRTKKPIGKLRQFRIEHLLVESPEGSDSRSVQICNKLPLPESVQIQWEKKRLYLFSNILALSCVVNDKPVRVHLVVHLDRQFYQGRESLKILRYTKSEFMLSLAKLMEITLPSTIPEGGATLDSEDRLVSLFFDRLRLEKYLYRMVRLKAKNPDEFSARMRRIATLLKAKNVNDSVNDEELSDLCKLIEELNEKIIRA